MNTDKVKINIRRGATQIGGSAVEITAPTGERIVLDLGLPLDAAENTPELLPDIRGLRNRTDDLLGIFISHAHQDHYALGKWIDPEMPVYIGAAANRIINATNDYLTRAGIDGTFTFKNAIEIDGFKTYSVGPFKIKTYPVDHAAYASLAFLIEVGGKRIFYTGDFRTHGRTPKRTKFLINRPPKNIDILLMEGSSIERLNPNQRFETEYEIENRFLKTFKETKGLALVQPSSQNIDRIVSVYCAAKRCGRTLVMASYTGFIIMSLKTNSLPNFTWADVKKLSENATKCHEITPAQIAQNPGAYVYIIGSGGLPGLEKVGLLTPDASYTYSMWDGYKETIAKPVIDKMKANGVSLHHIHTSGHADVPTLREFVAALKPRVLVPIHTFYPQKFEELFGEFAKVEMHSDNQEFEV